MTEFTAEATVDVQLSRGGGNRLRKQLEDAINPTSIEAQIEQHGGGSPSQRATGGGRQRQRNRREHRWARERTSLLDDILEAVRGVDGGGGSGGILSGLSGLGGAGLGLGAMGAGGLGALASPLFTRDMFAEGPASEGIRDTLVGSEEPLIDLDGVRDDIWGDGDPPEWVPELTGLDPTTWGAADWVRGLLDVDPANWSAADWVSDLTSVDPTSWDAADWIRGLLDVDPSGWDAADWTRDLLDLDPSGWGAAEWVTDLVTLDPREWPEPAWLSTIRDALDAGRSFVGDRVDDARAIGERVADPVTSRFDVPQVGSGDVPVGRETAPSTGPDITIDEDIDFNPTFEVQGGLEETEQEQNRAIDDLERELDDLRRRITR